MTESWVTVGDVFADLPSLKRGETTAIPNHNAPNQQQKTADRIAETEQGGQLYESHSQRTRLVAAEPAPTLVCSGPRPQWYFGHPTEPRGLTVRERARLQGFPDSFVFHGGMVAGRVQTGNAVPVDLAAAVVGGVLDD